MTTPSNIRGVAAVVAAGASFVSCDTCMKLALGSGLPPFEVLALRGVAGTVWCLPVLLASGLGSHLPQIANRWVLIRALSECLAVLMFINLLKRMSLGDLTALMQTAPLIILLVGALVWRDRIGAAGSGLIALGFLGALMVAQPGSAAASPVALFALVSAALAAGRDILSRKVPPEIPTLVAALSTILVVMMAAAFANTVGGTWVMPTVTQLLLMALAGLGLFGGQALIMLGFRLAKPAVAAPFLYVFTFWAVLYGLFIFGDWPNGIGLAGIVLIVASGISVVMLEDRRRRLATAATA